jgi:hypothetical protein
MKLHGWTLAFKRWFRQAHAHYYDRRREMIPERLAMLKKAFRAGYRAGVRDGSEASKS